MHPKASLGLLPFLLFFHLSATSAAQVQLTSIRWTEKPRALLRLDFSATPAYRIVPSTGATRLLIDLRGTVSITSLSHPPAGHPVASRITTLPDKAGNGLRLRLRIDLKAPAKFKSHLENLRNGTRLVIEWPNRERAAGKTIAVPSRTQPANGAQGRKPPAPVRSPVGAFTVAVDAGHGGKDTGAIGPGGTLEKDVALAIARRLAGLIRAEPGWRVVMVRNGDRFVALHRRAEIARQARADLFVSLHADANEKARLRGSTVFILSDQGASSTAARWLAHRENTALLGRIALGDKSSGLAARLVDRSRNATLEASGKAARKVLRELGKDFPLQHRTVRKAGFAVLKSLDMPSILVEIAFISNPEEERRLTDPRYQKRWAQAVFNGIRAYSTTARQVLPAVLRLAEAGKN